MSIATVADAIQALPNLLKEGLEVYKTLKDDMQRALGLKQYAEHLTNIVETFRKVNEYLNESEKAVLDKLNSAHRLAQEGLDKAAVVVTVIKEQSRTLVLVLDPSTTGTDQEKMFGACQYFATFAKAMEEKVKEAEDALREASDILHNAQSELTSIVNTLQRLQNQFIEERKKAEAEARREAYGGAAAGIILGPIGLILAYSIAAGVTEGHTIPEIEEDFKRQRKRMAGYIEGFEKMWEQTKELQEGLDGKRHKLIDIHGKLSATGALAETNMTSIPLLHFDLIRKNAQALVDECERFSAHQ